MENKEIKRSFWESAKIFLNPLISEKKTTIKSVIVYFFWVIPDVYHIYIIQKLVFYIENHNKEEFINLIIIYAIINIVYEIILFFTKSWGWVINVNTYRKVVHREYLKKFTSLENTETEKIGTGRLISIIDKGIDTWALLLNELILNFLGILIAFIYSLYTVVSINLICGIVFFFIYIGLHLLGGYINSFTLKVRRERQENWQFYTKQIVKIIMSKFEILQTSKVEYEINNLDNITNKAIEINYKMAKYIHIFFRLPEAFITWSKFAILLYLGLQIFDGKATFSLFVGVFGVFTVLDSAINRSMNFYKDFTHQFTSVEKLWDFFDTTPEIQGYETGKEFEYKTGAIELQNITFGYEENKKIFKDFNLKLGGGKITAFVGNSGGGKTTLVKIISQYIKQDFGKVLIDGQDLEKISLKSYYKNIGYLTQEPSVFDGTILDNLTYALEIPLPNPPPKGEGTRTLSTPFSPGGKGWDRGMLEKIEKIIKLSKCEFIYDFEKGLETEIGERGVRLSGGQKQRLAIAKIMLKDPKIIILDEPTSALDSFSEELITKAMNNLFEGRTVLVIAHRLQTVKHADEIIVIENGEIQERGRHNELVEKNGIYNRMLELQSGF